MIDVIIIGGGPAGSALGCYLSLAGISNTIIDKANHPRPHVGESMVTSSTRVFKELGFLETMEKECFVKKFGATWHAPQNKTKLAIRFAEFAQPGVGQNYTYHVDRGKFDLLLLKHAEKLGSQVHQGVNVKEVTFEEGRATGVKVLVGDQEVHIKSKMVVDASGRNTVLGRQMRMKKNDPLFNQYAVHAWFSGVDRGTDDTQDHIHIYFLPVERGWVWQIPITSEITSVGVVAEKVSFQESRLDLEGWFHSQMQTNLNLTEAMLNAKRVNEWKTEGDYSYSMTQYCGDGFLLVGDAARFVDPIFSSGVSIALYGAKFATERIKLALETNDFSRELFLPYEKRLREGADIWYEFIRLYYKLLPLFTYFIQSKDYRLQVLQLLQGEVFDRSEVPVLDAMKKYVEVVEKSDSHVFKKQLTEIPIDDFAKAFEEASTTTE